MRWPPWSPVTFLARRNRFACSALLPDGSEVLLHLPNSGRLAELLLPGTRGAAAPSSRPRHTWGDLLALHPGDFWVVVDARLPPLLLLEGLSRGKTPELGSPAAAREAQREVLLGESRVDLFLPSERLYVETKSVTLAREGRALFPDAPTLRGRRHLRELRLALSRGFRAAVAFVVQRPDACLFACHASVDPAFCQELALFSREGGETYAYACVTREGEVSLLHRLPVEMP